MSWEDFAVCHGRPYDWWETGDEGNRLAMTLCRLACPVAGECAAADPAPVGMIRAGVAYSITGTALKECPCGRPIDQRGARLGFCATCEPAARCGTPSGFEGHRSRKDTICGPCRVARNRTRRVNAAVKRHTSAEVRHINFPPEPGSGSVAAQTAVSVVRDGTATDPFTSDLAVAA